jgi:hypothetical protein
MRIARKFQESKMPLILEAKLEIRPIPRSNCAKVGCAALQAVTALFVEFTTAELAESNLLNALLTL